MCVASAAAGELFCICRTYGDGIFDLNIHVSFAKLCRDALAAALAPKRALDSAKKDTGAKKRKKSALPSDSEESSSDASDSM